MLASSAAAAAATAAGNAAAAAAAAASSTGKSLPVHASQSVITSRTMHRLHAAAQDRPYFMEAN